MRRPPAVPHGPELRPGMQRLDVLWRVVGRPCAPQSLAWAAVGLPLQVHACGLRPGRLGVLGLEGRVGCRRRARSRPGLPHGRELALCAGAARRGGAARRAQAQGRTRWPLRRRGAERALPRLADGAQPPLRADGHPAGRRRRGAGVAGARERGHRLCHRNGGDRQLLRLRRQRARPAVLGVRPLHRPRSAAGGRREPGGRLEGPPQGPYGPQLEATAGAEGGARRMPQHRHRQLGLPAAHGGEGLCAAVLHVACRCQRGDRQQEVAEAERVGGHRLQADGSCDRVPLGVRG
mmetsp:Transcript_102817/g.297248  ORF Transcript_102817/g.297248 Transcript_102817/m.297248 type:complete len:292 (-) Transcript_102817:1832-2707(-)